MFDIMLGDIETIAIPDSAFEEDFDGDGEICYPGVIEFVEVVVAVSFVSLSHCGQEVVIWIFGSCHN